MQARASAAEQQTDELKDTVRRLSPLLDWERDAHEQIEGLRVRLATAEASLQLASSERDALLRENDKIILHYRKVRTRLRLPNSPHAHEARRSAVLTAPFALRACASPFAPRRSCACSGGCTARAPGGSPRSSRTRRSSSRWCR